jgi:radical SAM protein with 4Fe4S-binding SPASM domain
MLYGWELIGPEEEALIVEGVTTGTILGGPYHLALFPTDKCNWNCFFCYTETLREIAAELPWPVLKRTLEEAVKGGLRGVSFGGGGESLIYTNLRELLAFLEENKLKIDSVKTNGSALSKEVARSFIKCDLKRLSISLNETDPVAFGAMNRCPPRLFEKSLQGIRNIVEARREGGSTAEIGVQVFLWKENFRRLPEMLAFLDEFGADYTYVASIEGLPKEQQMSEADRAEFKEIIAGVLPRFAKKIQFNLCFEDLHEYAIAEQVKYAPEAIALPDLTGAPDRIEYCYMGWYAAVVSASGDLFPCCHFATDPKKSFGNLHKSSLNEIWRGDRAAKYREEMRHLLLTDAETALLPRGSCFIGNLCLERTSCAFNYYLASPETYRKIDAWANSGPRSRYKSQEQVKAQFLKVARGGKKLLKDLIGNPRG